MGSPVFAFLMRELFKKTKKSRKNGLFLLTGVQICVIISANEITKNYDEDRYRYVFYRESGWLRARWITAVVGSLPSWAPKSAASRELREGYVSA